MAAAELERKAQTLNHAEVKPNRRRDVLRDGAVEPLRPSGWIGKIGNQILATHHHRIANKAEIPRTAHLIEG
jgi:hypothetical protein